MDPITQGVISNGIFAAMTAAWQSSRNPIRITYPRSQETLTQSEPLGPNSVSYPIKGTLKLLPKAHAIWLLTQKDNTGHLWPQSFFPVQYNPEDGSWYGRVNGTGGPLISIVAVVAPPTSQDFFRYFHEVGGFEGKYFPTIEEAPAGDSELSYSSGNASPALTSFWYCKCKKLFPERLSL